MAAVVLCPCAGLVAGPDGEPGPSPTVPQTQPWRVTSFLEDAALEGRGIFFLDFEKNGTVWIAVSDGLYRYDGYRWERYTSEHGLPSDHVRCVLVTRDGELWVGTDRGAGVFDGETFDTRGSEERLAGPSVRRIVEGPDGALWFACDQWPVSNVRAGLTRYRNGAWKSWRAEDGLPSDYVSDIFVDSTGGHWILTRGGLARIDEDDRLERPLEETGLDECADYVWSMVETADGDLVATTERAFCVRRDGRWHTAPHGPPKLSVPQLVVTLDGSVLACTTSPAGTFLEWKDDRLHPLWTSPLDTRGTVQSIREAPDGSIWLTGTNLLGRWERLGGEWHSYDDLPTPRLRDSQGGIWFADEPGGVLRLHDRRWTTFPGASRPLVWDTRGGVWMRTTGGLARWDGDGLTTHGPATMGLKIPQDVHVDGEGDVWVAERKIDDTQRVARFDGRSWISLPPMAMHPAERIVSGTPDSRSGMWYVVKNEAQDAFRLMQATRDGLTEVSLPETARRYEKPMVRADHSGRLWLFGFLGLYRLDRETSGAVWEEITELPGRQVVEVVERGDEVWFSYLGGTGGSGGVTRLLDGVWDHFPGAARGLVARSGDDALFFTDPRGVFITARGATERPRLLVLPRPTWVSSIVSGLDGDLWIGAASEVFHYTPDGVPPETVIVRGGKNVSHKSDLLLALRAVERFKPLDRQGDFDVSVKLDDGPWSEFGPLTDGTVRVEARTTGAHVVQVRVRDQGRDVDPTPASWEFRVLSVPLQERVWFRPLIIGVVLTVLLLAGLSLSAYRREFLQRRRQQELEHEILEISEREQRRIGQDLHDGLGQRLTSISFQCEALRGALEASGAHTEERAREIGAAVRTAIFETRVLSHALYPAEVDSGDLELALDHLVTSVASGFAGRCTYRHRGSAVGLNRDDVLNLYRLVQEALGNAIRHSGARTLTVESRNENGEWVVDISDDGCGFDTRRSESQGLGMRIMRYRAGLIGGSLSIVSRPGAGTTVRCVVRAERRKS